MILNRRAILEQGNKKVKFIKSELITNYIMLATLQIKNN
ncbi:hypothetical protein [Staphylococcus aureus]|nr:hypothetical protein [Staphylococcus aureus]UXT62199.1 hypothetical protein MUA94_10775 [Staphylococcus aureus]UXT71113.1 hypothetical protein MUA35_03045 [Staphylococcus aureus]UXT95141.1 hypothetical protein MUA69_03035 [Staphylococcus aureus]UXU13444.1 hypothetical protein MUA59_03030 [Staphylococcus aureus]WOL35667.1 hypothetical protein RS960_02895 [Staphylococcus aureus]